MSPPSTSDQDLTGQRIFNALRQSIISNFGNAGWGSVAASLSGASLRSILLYHIVELSHGQRIEVKYFSPTTNLCIVRVARDPYRTAWAGVSMLSNIEGKGYLPNVIHVSGTRLFSLLLSLLCSLFGRWMLDDGCTFTTPRGLLWLAFP